MKKKFWLSVCTLTTMLLILTACGDGKRSTSQKETYKACFIYIGPPGELGWTYEHERGRQQLENQFGNYIATKTLENITAGPDAARIMRRCAQEGYDMIFATASGYMDAMFEVAEEYPAIKFEHCSGVRTLDNMSTYFGRMYQPRYLSGIVAGKMTASNFIGYVAAFPNPAVLRGINAFTLGARAVNPNAEVHVVWTLTGYDPVKDREAAVTLLDAGADIITQHQDTTAPQKVTQERGALSIGYNSDMRVFVGDTVLTSPVWHWGNYYIHTVQADMDDSWATHQYWGGMKEGVVGLASFSPKVPVDVQNLVEAAQDKIVEGSWDVFCGPIQDQGGAEVVAADQCMADGDMLNMNFFVAGVVGTLPDN